MIRMHVPDLEELVAGVWLRFLEENDEEIQHRIDAELEARIVIVDDGVEP